MMEALDQAGSHALLLNVVATVGAASLMNGLIFAAGWDAAADAARRPSFAPPGFVVGFVWMILLALMAGARWRLSCAAVGDAGSGGALVARTAVTTLILFCLAWPLYSMLFGHFAGGLLGCLAGLCLALSAAARAWPVSRWAAGLIVPTLVWLLFATAILAAQLLAA